MHTPDAQFRLNDTVVIQGHGRDSSTLSFWISNLAHERASVQRSQSVVPSSRETHHSTCPNSRHFEALLTSSGRYL